MNNPLKLVKKIHLYTGVICIMALIKLYFDSANQILKII